MDHNPLPPDSFSLPPQVATTTTSQLFGILVAWALYGCVFVQLYTYCVSFPEETWRLRALIYSIVAIETVQTIMLGHYALNTFGAHFGDLTQVTRLGTNWISVPLLTSIVSCTVQCFLIARIYYLSKMRILPLICILLSVIQAASGIGTAVLGHLVDDFRKFSEEPAIPVLGTVWVTVGAGLDVLITGGLVYSLYKLRSGYEKSEAVVWRLIRMFIETGSLTAMVQLIMTILFFATPGKPYHRVPSYFLSMLYAINLLMIQNSRIGVKSALTKRSSSFSNVRVSDGISSFAARKSSGPSTQSRDDQVIQLGDRGNGKVFRHPTEEEHPFPFQTTIV